MPLGDINYGLDFGLNGIQQGVAIAADWFTHKAIIYEKEGTPSMREGFGGIVDRAKGIVGLGKGSEGAVTLYHYEEVSETTGAEYAETPIRGRSQPYIHYTGTGTTKITFAAKLVAGGQQYAFFHNTDDVIHDVNLIRSWVYPEYPEDGGPLKPPPTLVLEAGELYRGVPGIIRSAEFTHMRPFNWYHVPMIVDVNIEFEVIYDKPVDRIHIRDKGMTNFGGSKQTSTTLLGRGTEKIVGVFTGGDASLSESFSNPFTNIKNPGAM